MKGIFLCLFPFLLLSACSPGTPSETIIQTAIAATDEAMPTAATIPNVTEMPTVKEKPTNTSEPISTPEQLATIDAPVDAPVQVSEAEVGQIYASAIRHMYRVDHSFDDPHEFPLVYIVTITDNGSLLYAPETQPQHLSPEVRQSIEAELADLQLEIIWIDSLNEAPVDSNNGMIADGQGIVITLGNILPQVDGTVQLPFYMVCGGLCLSGKTYVLGEIDGAWNVTGSVGVVIEG